ncbi:hypothetical protein AM202_04985, partial [Actinobacillus minor 202]
VPLPQGARVKFFNFYTVATSFQKMRKRAKYFLRPLISLI